MEKAILFDLDGTLWDSAEGVAASWNLALQQLKRPERLDERFVHSVMGKTMDVIAREIFPDDPFEAAERMMDLCLQKENEYLREHGGILYPELERTLRILRESGYFLAIVSNCQEGYIEAFLDYHQLGSCFDDTECFGHTRHGKGENIRLVMQRNQIAQAVYLGDTRGDYDAAREAGIPFIHAAYGFGTVPEGTPAIQAFRELPSMMKNFFRA